MVSRVVRERYAREAQQNSERFRGLPPSASRMSSHRVIETQVGNFFHLPSVENTDVVQNSDGTFKYIDGWTDGPPPAVGG